MNKKMAGVALAVALVSPPAWADPTVITACQTISQPGAYVLANDIGSGTVEDADCLTITVSNVTIEPRRFLGLWGAPWNNCHGRVAGSSRDHRAERVGLWP